MTCSSKPSAMRAGSNSLHPRAEDQGGQSEKNAAHTKRILENGAGGTPRSRQASSKYLTPASAEAPGKQFPRGSDAST